LLWTLEETVRGVLITFWFLVAIGVDQWSLRLPEERLIHAQFDLTSGANLVRH
jgi:hypothetical protein